MDTTFEQWRFREGDAVFGSDGGRIGKVVGCIPNAPRPDYLIVQKGMLFGHNYYVPTSAVSNYENGEVYLSVTKDEALHRGWDVRPSATAGTGTEAGSRAG